MKEVYKRELSVGDYCLFCVTHYRFDSVVVGKVLGDGNVYIKLNDELTVIKQDDTHIYKLSGDLALFERYWNIGRQANEFVKEKYMGISYKEQDRITEIFGRPLSVGDFVMYRKNNVNFTKRGIEYGVVMDTQHILCYPDKIVKAKLVYKIEARTKEEDSLYKIIVDNYKDKQIRVLQNLEHTGLEIGDIFRKRNTAYVYMGEYLYTLEKEVCYSSRPHKKRFRIRSAVIQLYLRVNLETKSGQVLFNQLKQCDLTGIADYIQKNSMIVKEFPRCFTMNLSKIRQGEYLGNLNKGDLLAVLKKEYELKFAPYTIWFQRR